MFDRNVLRALARYDIVFLVDEYVPTLHKQRMLLNRLSNSSGSMIPLWKQARDALVGVVNASCVYSSMLRMSLLKCSNRQHRF